jgi:hypothetical protein
MTKKQQALELLKQGLPPTEIARQMRTSPAVTMQYLALNIGEGSLRRSDVAFSIPRELRAAIEAVITEKENTNPSFICRELVRRGVTANKVDVAVYVNYRRARVVLGDMYELIRALELRLHDFIKQAFTAEFGEENWWRSGVPDVIRADCAALREKDPEPAEDPYCYTHLISLREILDKKWAILSRYLPEDFRDKKKDLQERLLRLNRIRNAVMHPVRKAVLTEDEFEFVRDLERDLKDMTVHLPSSEVAHADPVTTEEAPVDLVVALTPTVEKTPPAEEAATPAQAGDPDAFVPSVKKAS